MPLLVMELKQPHPPNPFFIVEEYMGGGELMQANSMDLLVIRSRTAACVFTLLSGRWYLPWGTICLGRRRRCSHWLCLRLN